MLSITSSAVAAWSDDEHAARRREVFAAKRRVLRAAFEEMGYEIPETYEDMVALSEQIVADGGGLQGLNLRADLPDGVTCTVAQGDLLGQQSGVVVVDVQLGAHHHVADRPLRTLQHRVGRLRVL